MRNTRLPLIGFVLVMQCTALSASAMAGVCDGWLPGPMIGQSEGINGLVEAMTVWTPPGSVPLLVVGGGFTTAGGAPASGVAAWDGASWRALGSGTNLAVYCLAVYNGDLIAGGVFSVAGGVQCNAIARWNGAVWQPLAGGLIEPNFGAVCHALTVYNGELIAAGRFPMAANSNGIPFTVNNIARWNGTTWNTVAGAAQPGVNGSVPENVEIKALTTLDNHLYAGGNFETAGGIPASNIARWDGALWGTLGGTGAGTNNYVQVLWQFAGELLIGGEFTAAGPSGGQFTANSVARWNPANAAWGTYGSGIAGTAVYAFQNYSGGILAGGWSHSGGPNLAFWNGATWSLFNGGAFGVSTPHFVQVAAFGVFNGNVIVGGWFNRLGPSQGPAADATNIGQWTGPVTAWRALWSPPPVVNAMTTLGSRVVAAGSFTHSTTNSTPAHNIVTWDGVNLAPVVTAVGGGEGTNSSIHAMVSYFLPGITGGNRLVAGGTFTSAGGVAANRIALYSEPALTLPNWSGLGSGFNNTVWAVERHNNVIYAGGDFTLSGATGVNRIAQWNGTSWAPLGSGMNGPVYALRSYNGLLYAGGAFTSAGGVSSGGFARWDGTSWTNIGGFFNGTIYALDLFTNENALVIGGVFPGINNSPNLARYSVFFGYSTFNIGGTNGAVRAIKSNAESVYIGGTFTSAGGIAVNNVAEFTSAEGWSSVDAGVNGPVYALTAAHGEIDAGGGFSAVNGSATSSPGWGRLSHTGAPWIAYQPFDQSVNCSTNVTFSVGVASGYNVNCLWRRNGIPLSNGATGHGNSISGADTATLTILSVQSVDAATYDCVVWNSCGSETSFPAVLSNSCCVGDIHVNQVVNIDDLLAVITHWGACPVPPTLTSCLADIAPSGSDGMVNIDDLLAVISGWGVCK